MREGSYLFALVSGATRRQLSRLLYSAGYPTCGLCSMVDNPKLAIICLKSRKKCPVVQSLKAVVGGQSASCPISGQARGPVPTNGFRDWSAISSRPAHQRTGTGHSPTTSMLCSRIRKSDSSADRHGGIAQQMVFVNGCRILTETLSDDSAVRSPSRCRRVLRGIPRRGRLRCGLDRSESRAPRRGRARWRNPRG